MTEREIERNSEPSKLEMGCFIGGFLLITPHAIPTAIRKTNEDIRNKNHKFLAYFLTAMGSAAVLMAYSAYPKALVVPAVTNGLSLTYELGRKIYKYKQGGKK